MLLPIVYFSGRGKELLPSFTPYSCHGVDASRFHSQEPQTLGCKARQACSFVKSFNWKHHNTAADRCVRPLWSLQGTFPCLGSLLLLLLPHHVRTATFFSRRRSGASSGISLFSSDSWLTSTIKTTIRSTLGGQSTFCVTSFSCLLWGPHVIPVTTA